MRTEEQKNRRTEEQKNRRTEEQMNRRTEEQKNRRTDEQKNRRTEEQMNRRTEEQKNRKTEKQEIEKRNERFSNNYVQRKYFFDCKSIFWGNFNRNLNVANSDAVFLVIEGNITEIINF